MPTASVFKGDIQTINGIIRAQDVKLTMSSTPGGLVPQASAATSGGGGGANGAVSLVQQAEWQLERTVNMLYEIGTQNVYYVGDRRKGQGKFTRVVGGASDFKKIVGDLGDICNAKENTLTLSAGAADCGPGGESGKVTYKLLGVTLVSIGASVTANDIVVTESMGIMFVDMEYS